jgi:hypothetical protein
MKCYDFWYTRKKETTWYVDPITTLAKQLKKPLEMVRGVFYLILKKLKCILSDIGAPVEGVWVYEGKPNLTKRNISNKCSFRGPNFATSVLLGMWYMILEKVIWFDNDKIKVQMPNWAFYVALLIKMSYKI